jgi:hypothetical protein
MNAALIVLAFAVGVIAGGLGLLLWITRNC